MLLFWSSQEGAKAHGSSHSFISPAPVTLRGVRGKGVEGHATCILNFHFLFCNMGMPDFANAKYKAFQDAG